MAILVLVLLYTGQARYYAIKVGALFDVSLHEPTIKEAIHPHLTTLAPPGSFAKSGADLETRSAPLLRPSELKASRQMGLNLLERLDDVFRGFQYVSITFSLCFTCLQIPSIQDLQGLHFSMLERLGYGSSYYLSSIPFG